MIRLLKSVGGPAFFGGITPFQVSDFRRFGRPYNVTLRVEKGDVQAFETFSTDVEDWHNRAHMAMEMATHTNMMDPLTNILLRDFWRLQVFIESKFEAASGRSASPRASGARRHRADRDLGSPGCAVLGGRPESPRTVTLPAREA